MFGFTKNKQRLQRLRAVQFILRQHHAYGPDAITGGQPSRIDSRHGNAYLARDILQVQTQVGRAGAVYVDHVFLTHIFHIVLQVTQRRLVFQTGFYCISQSRQLIQLRALYFQADAFIRFADADAAYARSARVHLEPGYAAVRHRLAEPARPLSRRNVALSTWRQLYPDRRHIGNLALGTSKNPAAGGGEHALHSRLAVNDLLHHLDFPVHALQRYTGIRLQMDIDLAIVHVGKKTAFFLAEHPASPYAASQRQTNDQPAPGQQFAQYGGIAFRQRRHGAFGQPAAAGEPNPHRQTRHQGQGDDHGSRNGRTDGQYQLPKQQSHQAANEQKRQHRHQIGGGGSNDGAVDFSRGQLPGPLRRGIIQASVAGYVLEHDDSAVHQHAHAQRQPAQGHDVEAQTSQLHENKADKNRHRNCRADNQRIAPAAEKQPHHQHRQQRSGKHRPGRVTQGITHIYRLIRHLVDAHIGIDQLVRFQPVQPRADTVDHSYCISLGLLLDGNLDPGHVIEPDPQGFLFVTILDARHFVQPYAVVVTHRYRQGRQLRQRGQTSFRATAVFQP